MSYSKRLDQLISDIGGCGKFQITVTSLLHISKTIVTWSMLQMAFNGQAPEFLCADSLNESYSLTEEDFKNATLDRCTTSGNSECKNFIFDGTMQTIVTEFDLVCGRKWIVATTTTIQMGGVMIGCFVAGHLGDWIGRKPTYFMSILILIIFNIVGYFSVSWGMYAFVRFMLGMAVGFFIAVYRNIIMEYVTSTWRPITFGIPSWSVEAGCMALVTYLSKSWKVLHIASAVSGIPVLFSWWIVPESFRWLITKGRYDEAKLSVARAARINGYAEPDISEVIEQAKEEAKTQQKHYTALDLFKTKKMAVKTVVFLFLWSSCNYAYYGLTFGLKNFAGDFYLNSVLTYAIEIPAEFVAIYLSNRFGRKKTGMTGFLFTALCGIINGVFQDLDAPGKVVILNVFAMSSKVGILIGWLPMAVLTTESYPTVIRSTSFGVVNTVARIGGMIAPQIVFLNDSIPGMLFFLSAGAMVLSACLCFSFTETKGQVLADTMERRIHPDLNEIDTKQSISNLSEQNKERNIELVGKQPRVCDSGPVVKSPDIQVEKL